MKRGLTILIILILIFPAVFAQSLQDINQLIKEDPELAQEMINSKLEKFKQEFNQQEIPGLLRKLSGEETVNLITESLTIGAIIENLNIKQIQSTEMEGSTLDIFMSDQTFEEIASGQRDLLTSLKDKTVTYKAKKLTTKIKMRVLIILLKLTKK